MDKLNEVTEYRYRQLTKSRRYRTAARGLRVAHRATWSVRAHATRRRPVRVCLPCLAAAHASLSFTRRRARRSPLRPRGRPKSRFAPKSPRYTPQLEVRRRNARAQTRILLYPVCEDPRPPPRKSRFGRLARRAHVGERREERLGLINSRGGGGVQAPFPSAAATVTTT